MPPAVNAETIPFFVLAIISAWMLGVLGISFFALWRMQKHLDEIYATYLQKWVTPQTGTTTPGNQDQTS
jgi:hypothetical protein